MTGSDASEADAAASRRATLRRIALGETGFERATVWSAVGFALSYAAFDATAAVGVGDPAVVGALAAVTAVAAVAFAATGGGAFPAILLTYGPFAGTFLRGLGPEPYVLPFTAGGPAAAAFTAPLALAGAVAVAVGAASTVVGYLFSRLAASR
ncbi:hypothetical protein DVK05_04245 [Halorubrum sp. Atlit-8R]|uniref:hypothetical protein n=1 Tax=unclassified Halorubrum TaxID=2642239 RepID=UPI000EF181B6|nr:MULTISPECIES: hypothetical protein [unclassified Halorubrum]RLM70838.1 hypothetical protein DVK08_01515 [Halorubrum sp. Atlit-9R]RLM71706.1 hypothetical protein DVK08_06255 [Halorubrum sp. Atlit-9R]RLM83009.1 hypothetical protein DVK05_04245 [Halorubrum sp. Atlit-8R]